MATVHEAAGRSPTWACRYGYIRIGEIEPHCIIDSLTYGCGKVEFVNIGGGRRAFGLRPLWPDDERQRDYQDFYSTLQADIAKNGLKVPVLLWKINGKLYVRYGASRLWVEKKAGREAIKAIICDFGCDDDYDLANWVPIKTPKDMIDALGDPKFVGTFEVSHERVDVHNVVPW